MEPEPRQKCFEFLNQDRGSMIASGIRMACESRERRRGLLGETTLDQNAGLWIVPCEAIHTFGMKVAIDSIFLDKKLRVRSLKTDLKPGRIAVCLRAHSVLELPVGTIARSATRVGDQLIRVEHA